MMSKEKKVKKEDLNKVTGGIAKKIAKKSEPTNETKKTNKTRSSADYIEKIIRR